MPQDAQDIPFEAGEELAFTPACLQVLNPKPVFILRLATSRERRYQRRLVREEGMQTHSNEDMRAEIINGLRNLWDEANSNEFIPKIEAYWQQLDEFLLQRKDDPTLTWEHEDDAAVAKLEADVAVSHKPYAKMRADNAEAGEVTMLALLAVAIISWDNVPVLLERDRGYLTINCVGDLREYLFKLDDKVGAKPGTCWMDLTVAAGRRVFLDAATEGNSASPSPSETVQPSSKPTTGRGRSKASASSKKTPAA